jgi:hypothetical protein
MFASINLSRRNAESAARPLQRRIRMQTSPSLSVEAVIVRGGGLFDAEVDGEIVALHVEKGSCYGLNKVGSRIWQLIEAPTAIGEICATLVSEYKIDPVTCERQVLDLLEELRAEGLIEIRAPSGGAGG